MSFLETVERAHTFLERHRRVSLRALRREFDLDPETLAELSDELVQVQHVAVLEGDVLVWTGEAPPSPERDPRAYTPKHLAEKILNSRSALEGERKQVTVLFADVKGSMELAEQLDPEDWHGILDRFLQILAEGVHRFEGTVNQYTGDGIMALVEAYFRLRDLGALAVKGTSAPLRVFELEGAGALRTRLDASRARGFTRFVGRVDEMAALEAALARAREGDGGVVGVVGEAGIGKSRLCHEFLERCPARGLATYEAQGVAHGKAIPFLPLLQLLRNVFGITEADSAAAAREKIAGRLLLLDRTFDETLPVLFDFLAVPDPERPAPAPEAGVRQHQLFALTRRVIQARQETTVTLLEDLHWFDAGSEAFLGPFVEARAGTRGLLLLNLRPEYRAPWMERPHYRLIPLRPLDAADATALLHALVGDDAALADLAAAIRDRTGGNPFFIE